MPPLSDAEFMKRALALQKMFAPLNKLRLELHALKHEMNQIKADLDEGQKLLEALMIPAELCLQYNSKSPTFPI